MIRISAVTFRKSANGLQENVMDTHRIEHRAWIGPTLFRAMRYIIGVRSLLIGTTLEAARLKKPEENSLRCVQYRCHWVPKHCRRFKILSI